MSIMTTNAMYFVITWQSPRGDKIDLTQRQIRQLRNAGTWLRDEHGEEFCQVHRGLHWGRPSYSDRQIGKLIAA